MYSWIGLMTVWIFSFRPHRFHRLTPFVFWISGAPQEYHLPDDCFRSGWQSISWNLQTSKSHLLQSSTVVSWSFSIFSTTRYHRLTQKLAFLLMDLRSMMTMNFAVCDVSCQTHRVFFLVSEDTQISHSMFGRRKRALTLAIVSGESPSFSFTLIKGRSAPRNTILERF